MIKGKEVRNIDYLVHFTTMVLVVDNFVGEIGTNKDLVDMVFKDPNKNESSNAQANTWNSYLATTFLMGSYKEMHGKFL